MPGTPSSKVDTFDKCKTEILRLSEIHESREAATGVTALTLGKGKGKDKGAKKDNGKGEEGNDAPKTPRKQFDGECQVSNTYKHKTDKPETSKVTRALQGTHEHSRNLRTQRDLDRLDALFPLHGELQADSIAELDRLGANG